MQQVRSAVNAAVGRDTSYGQFATRVCQCTALTCMADSAASIVSQLDAFELEASDLTVTQPAH